MPPHKPAGQSTVMLHVLLKNDYRRIPCVPGLVRDLGWQYLEYCRKNARLLLFYKGLHGLSAIPRDSLCWHVHNTRHSKSDTFIGATHAQETFTRNVRQIECSCKFQLPEKQPTNQTAHFWSGASVQVSGKSFLYIMFLEGV